MNATLPSSLHVDSGRGFRSTQRQTLYLLRGLHRRGARVMLCCPKAGRLYQHAGEEGIPTAPLTIRSAMDFPSTVRLARHFGEWQPDIVHAHDAPAHAVARAAAGLNPEHAPHHGMVRSCDGEEDDEALNRLQNSDPQLRWHASAPRIRARLEQRGVPASQIDLVPHGVDLEAFADLPRTTPDPWGLRARGVRVLGTVGHLSRRRNVALLLQAFSRLRRRMPEVRLLVVGEGPQTRTLHKLAGSLEVVEEVTFAGAFDDLRAVYAVLDVFVLASDHEVSGRALLDAMAAGVPVVCTASAGVLGLARHGESSLVVPPRDAQTLADSVARVLQDAELAGAIAGGGLAVAQRHSLEQLTDNTLASYARLSARAGGGQVQ